MFRRGLSLFVLAFSLLFAQQGGFAHELSHAARSAQSDKQLPHSKVCDQCGAYSQVVSGAVSALSFALPPCAASVYFFTDATPVARHFFHQLSRAPPLFA